ncbi:dethiobiotin synthase [Thiohalophilus thiocyanatoxydans]|uniref:ATP-dependent dethiobiotin synthetase BioD n=1 Tax=Thiohalophilus thiocyanatoxydans TaxID=381308 RepID=A0A4R8IUI5_9GAMM|nr:dethiobiotin synthase [Thiohalophilus thiocyanatoxydans]TDY04084.1 dethiobiotin synthetase [Thiohalophilus thiocyanatoxydans]
MTDAAYPGIFVTGTDTEIGKTVCSCLLIDALQQRGLRVAAMKPVASGGQYRQGQLVNDDALQLQQQSGLNQAYELVNPYVFEPPVAPHLAARQAGEVIRPEPIQQAFSQLKAEADQIVVEGVGGWRVPLAEDFAVSDLPRLLNLPVVLVIGMRLGCLNHALLTIESIEQTGSHVVGWMANYLDPAFDAQQANLQTLEYRLEAPCLAQIPYHGEPFTPLRQQEVAAGINISWL